MVTAVLVGIVGAFAVAFVIIEVGKFPDTLDLKNQLFLITLSVMAGFASRQLLPSLTETFEKELTRLAGRQAEFQAQRDQDTLRVNAISRANTALASATTPSAERIAAAQALAALKLPTDRTVNILQGRLYRAADQLGPAIESLTNFLQAKGATRDVDYADVLYNRACYECMRNADQDLQQALTDLRESVRINPANKALAKEDPDFDNFKHNRQLHQQFEQLVAA
jgi:cell fate (sporulation/competence/biofilm development) regulator YlbF (YheA/YmcA/DUF963 family)